MVRLDLTEQMAENLKDIVDCWIGEHDEATSDVEADPTFEEPEDMLDAIDGMHQQYKDAVEIRQRLWIGIRGAVTTRGDN
jgi:hypothetical protein